MGGCTPGSSPSPRSSACGVPTAAPAGTDAPAGQAPGGGGLQVVDHGYTQVGSNGYAVSLGALVRNTSGRVAYRTTVTLRVLDAQGRTAIDALNARQLILEIPVIQPGQQVPVGSSAGLRTDLSLNGAPDNVASLDVLLGSTRWLPAQDAGLFPAVTTTFRGIERDGPDSASGGVRYSVSPTSCRQLVARGTFAVFVNSAGAVVGGAFDPDYTPPHCGTTRYDGSLDVLAGIPTGIDEARTQVSSYCDIAPVGGGDLKPSGAPFN